MVGRKAIVIQKANIAAILFAVVSVSCAASTPSFKNHPEPDGFRGIKWGTVISTLKDMEGVEKVKSSDTASVWYTRRGDALIIGKAKLENIFYSFWMGEFESVWINFKDDNNFEVLKRELIEQYGKPYEPEMGSMKARDRLVRKERSMSEYPETLYVWWGKNTEMWLSYLKELHKGTLTINSARMSAEKRAYDEHKEKEDILKEREILSCKKYVSGLRASLVVFCK